jgi:hypothetical protein
MIITSTSKGFIVGSRADLLESGQLRAWAERHVRKDPDIRWILGNFVEADNANSNGHIFPLDELLSAQKTIAGKPLNMLHREHYIIGYFAGAQLLDKSGEELHANANDDDKSGYAYIEALAGLWHTRFPEEYYQIQRAHKEGALFFSMEAIPEAVACPTCQHEVAFAGLESETYCAHMQGATGPKVLRRPTFNGGAIIMPPVRPGWQNADVKTISQAYEQAEALAADAQAEFPHLGQAEWQWMMTQITALAAHVDAREFSNEQREKMAKKGNAMPDGSYPIANEQDLRNAIHAIGRAKNPAATRQHIKKMARKLGLEELIPEGW